MVELMSPTTAEIDTGKRERAGFRTRDYFFNPDPNSLQGWSLTLLIAISHWCRKSKVGSESKGLWLGTWSGTLIRDDDLVTVL